jgi:hypothetical protein
VLRGHPIARRERFCFVAIRALSITLPLTAEAVAQRVPSGEFKLRALRDASELH